MKLAILGSRGIPARYGGFETFAEQIALRLAAAGVNVTVFCPSDARRPDSTYQGVLLRYIRQMPLGQFSELVWDLRCLWAARTGFDIVYMLGVGAGPALWIPRVFGSTVWVNSDGLEWKRSKWGRAQRLYLKLAEFSSVRFASRVIADANAISDYLKERYPRKKRISMIAYGAELRREPHTAVTAEVRGLKSKKYYLVVCRLEPENHVLEMIEGFLRSKSSLPLVIVGNVLQLNSYVQQLLTYKSDRVQFLGAIFDQDELGALRGNAKAYLHGHSVGGTNPSLLEAMACANLVIAHDNPFNREVLSSSGLFFSRSQDIAEIVDAIEDGRLDVDSKRQQAFAIAREQYSWEKIAQEYLHLLRQDASI